MWKHRWARFIVPENAWDVVGKRLEAIVGEVLSKPPESVFEPDPRIRAALGELADVYRAYTRSIVTRVGMHAPELVEPFFQECSKASEPFDVVCRRITEDNEEVTFTVKVVSGPRAFNSTTRARLEEASKNVYNPVVLTLFGHFKDSNDHMRYVGRAVWLDGCATWGWLSHRKRAHKVFEKLVWEAFYPVREKLIERVRSVRERRRGKRKPRNQGP